MHEVWLHLLLLVSVFFFLHPLNSTQPVQEAVQKVPIEIITESSPCSATCGLGLRTQTLCLLNDSIAAMEKEVQSGAEVTKKCRFRRVQCMEKWQCGLQTMTVTSGQRVEVDCVVDVMEAMGRFSWRVSWRYARGIITSDDALFAHWEAPELDRVVLDPIREEDAGTYRCDVQDVTYRRVKRAYWGIRVLPIGVLNLDYESSLVLWDESKKNKEEEEQEKILPFVLLMVGISVVVIGVFAALLKAYKMMKRSKKRGT